MTLEPIKTTFAKGGIPLVYGDVVFDQLLGGTILSTEDIFVYLAKIFSPDRILLAGIEAGVFADYPHKQNLIPVINPDNYENTKKEITGSAAPDVTGGMESKVDNMLSILAGLPHASIQIFSGMEPGSVKEALENHVSGTIISNKS